MKYAFFLFALFSFSHTSIYSQSMIADGLHRVLFTKKDTVYEFYAVRPSQKIKINSDRMYYWYRPDTILVTQGGYDERVLEGDYTEFYPGKSLKVKGNFLHGLKDGEWLSWYPDGRLNTTEYWVKGVLQERVQKNKPAAHDTVPSVKKKP